LFAYGFFSKNTNFLLMELILIIFFLSSIITPFLMMGLILACGALLLIPLHKISFQRCPGCGTLWKSYADIFECPVCGRQSYRSLFSDIP
jgi:hypothetical protein